MTDKPEVEAEKMVVAAWRRAGAEIIHAACEMDGIPTMLGRSAPDIRLKYRGAEFLVEVKHKNRWVHWAPDSLDVYYTSEYLKRWDVESTCQMDVTRTETGFDAHSFENYMHIHTHTGIPVYVLFHHDAQPPTGWFWGRLDLLAKTARYWAGANVATGIQVDGIRATGMVLFDGAALSPCHVASPDQHEVDPNRGMLIS